MEEYQDVIARSKFKKLIKQAPEPVFAVDLTIVRIGTSNSSYLEGKFSGTLKDHGKKKLRITDGFFRVKRN